MSPYSGTLEELPDYIKVELTPEIIACWLKRDAVNAFKTAEDGVPKDFYMTGATYDPAKNMFVIFFRRFGSEIKKNVVPYLINPTMYDIKRTC